MSAKFLLPVTICAVAFWVVSAFSKESPEGQGTGSWTAGAGVYGGFGLGSEKIRAELDLSEEQEREISALIAESEKLWETYLVESAAARDGAAAAAYAVLSEPQKGQIKEMKAVKDSWFQMIGDGRTLGAAGLDAEKEAEVRKVLEAHQKEVGEVFRSVESADPEAAERSRELQEKYRTMLAEVQAEVRGILGEVQFDAHLTRVAQSQFQGLVQMGRIGKELGLSDELREKLGEWAERRRETAGEIGKIEDAKERAERWNAWMKEPVSEVFDMLTEDQKAAVKALPEVEGMWLFALSSPGNLDGIGLGEERREEVQKAVGAYLEKQTELAKPSEKMVAKSREVQAKYAKMVEEVKTEIRSHFSDSQFDALLTRIAAFQMPYLSLREEVAGELELTVEQKEALEKVRSDLRAGAGDGGKVWAERRGIYDEAAKLLTPEQREKMAELTRPQAVVRRGEGLER